MHIYLLPIYIVLIKLLLVFQNCFLATLNPHLKCVILRERKSPLVHINESGLIHNSVVCSWLVANGVMARHWMTNGISYPQVHSLWLLLNKSVCVEFFKEAKTLRFLSINITHASPAQLNGFLANE